jgi:hypothetical protein
VALAPQTILLAIQTLVTARRSLKKMNKALNFLRLMAEVGRAFPKIGARVAEALEDGSLSPEDAEHFAIDVAREIDIKVNIKDIDVVTEEAENHLLAFIAIVTANTMAAKGK